MQITVKGFKPKRSAELSRAAEFFASKLMDPRTVRNIVLDIERTPKSDVQGECIDEDGTRNPRWFTINLRGARGDSDIIETLAHEMVHVKQYVKNELKSGICVPAKGGFKIYSKWMGEVWKPKAREDHYFDSPWEIDAYGREVGLYQKWLEHNKNETE